MNEKGFSNLNDYLAGQGGNKPQVYVHVLNEDKQSGNVLRIGKAKNGVIDRWIKQSWGHQSTFLWSIGSDKRYASYALRYPNYLAFFASLSEKRTRLYFLSCELDEMNRIEKELIHHFFPVWESYKKTIKKYLLQNPTTRENLSEYGRALDIIETCRTYHSEYPQSILDATNNSYRSKLMWAGS